MQPFHEHTNQNILHSFKINTFHEAQFIKAFKKLKALILIKAIFNFT